MQGAICPTCTSHCLPASVSPSHSTGFALEVRERNAAAFLGDGQVDRQTDGQRSQQQKCLGAGIKTSSVSLLLQWAHYLHAEGCLFARSWLHPDGIMLSLMAAVGLWTQVSWGFPSCRSLSTWHLLGCTVGRPKQPPYVSSASLYSEHPAQGAVSEQNTGC